MLKDIINQNESITPNGKEMAVLKEYFPACFKMDGEGKQTFDLERFKAAIAGQTEVVQEGYELKFLGKSYAKLLASTDTTTVIQSDDAHNSLPENANSGNIYISGDNLDGLKHLLRSYAKSIKCIYIDPPYNTGSDGFVYQDSFNYTKENLQEKLSVSPEEAERILNFTKRGSASHSAWLMFMYTRLVLARDLLTEDGVIFISIDDNEQANLKLLCDDVFGEENFLANMIWKKKQGGGNDSKNIVNEHEYVILYSKNISLCQLNLDTEYKLDDNLYSFTDELGEYGLITLDKSSIQFSESLVFEIEDKDGNKYLPRIVKGKQSCWRWSRRKVQEDFDKLVFKNGKVYTKYYRPEGVIAKSLLVDTRFGRTESGLDDIKNVFDNQAYFSYPKPVSLLYHILNIGTSSSDTILDFFSGSGTTAHAVMKLNAEDGGSRKFIAIQLPEVLSPEQSSQKAAFDFLQSQNLPTTLDYIGIERIKRAAVKLREAHPDKEMDMGFRHYVLSEPNQHTLDKLYTFEQVSNMADTTILDDFGVSTVLATWLNADGYGLTAQAEVIDLAGYKAYHYQKHLYLIDAGFGAAHFEALVGKYSGEGYFSPENVVIFGYSFPLWSVNEMLDKNLRILNDGEKNLKVNLSVRY